MSICPINENPFSQICLEGESPFTDNNHLLNAFCFLKEKNYITSLFKQQVSEIGFIDNTIKIKLIKRLNRSNERCFKNPTEKCLNKNLKNIEKIIEISKSFGEVLEENEEALKTVLRFNYELQLLSDICGDLSIPLDFLKLQETLFSEDFKQNTKLLQDFQNIYRTSIVMLENDLQTLKQNLTIAGTST